MRKSSFILSLILVQGALFTIPAWSAEIKLPARLAVHAGAYERSNTPVYIRFEHGAVPDGVVLEEVTKEGRVPVPVQLEKGASDRLCWILPGKTTRDEKRTFELSVGSGKADGTIAVKKDDKKLDVSCGGLNVLRYHHALVPPPKGVDKLYTRSGFIHPLWSPAGEVLTTIHPGDHYHHLGLWNPWTKTKFEGRTVDFWNLKKGEGTVRFEEFDQVIEGPVFGGFTAEQSFVNLKTPQGEKRAIDETKRVRIWQQPDPAKNGFLLDYESAQRCASESPITLVKYRYGGFSIRATEKWNKTNSRYLTSEGKGRDDGHQTRSRWCILSGETGAGTSGVLFMSHPENFNHPEPMRIWPSSSNNGAIFFNYMPAQDRDWNFEPGKEYVRKYRLHVFDGDLPVEQAERLWNDFAHPPEVKWE